MAGQREAVAGGEEEDGEEDEDEDDEEEDDEEEEEDEDKEEKDAEEEDAEDEEDEEDDDDEEDEEEVDEERGRHAAGTEDFALTAAASSAPSDSSAGLACLLSARCSTKRDGMQPCPIYLHLIGAAVISLIIDHWCGCH